MFVAGNFSATETLTVTIPEGKWYNYYEQVEQTETTVTLIPGALLILTGTPQVLPTMRPCYSFYTDVEDVILPPVIDILPPYNVEVYTLSGQLIQRQTNAMNADLTGLNNGLYLVKIEKNGQKQVKKVIR